MKDQIFQSITHGNLFLENVIDLIRLFLEENPKAEYSLVIGSDSQEKLEIKSNKKMVSVVTAIVVHRKGFGGRYFWHKKRSQEIYSLRDKIYKETIASLDFAKNFVPLLKKSLNGNSPKYNLEIHVDVGEHGETREMIKEVVGMVNGNGFIARTKPESFGATYVADRHT